MLRKIFVIPLLCLGMVFFVQCSDDPVEPASNPALKAGGNGNGGGGGGGGGNGGGGGGGGHVETAGNNLSFPAILADGYAVTPVTEPMFTVPYDGEYSGLTAEEIAWLEANGYDDPTTGDVVESYWYPQQTEGNLWQAETFTATSTVVINWINWGDAIEAVNPKLRRPYRLELSIFQTLTETMTAYTMAELEYPSSSSELQGTNQGTYESFYAAVASPNSHIVVQMTEGIDPANLAWNADVGAWQDETDPDNPVVIDVIPVAFGVENNVGGKLIFGASQKGWKPTQLGAHRITFYLENSVIDMTGALIGNLVDPTSETAGFIQVIEGETNTPVVDPVNNITYVDVTVEPGGGGGGGH